MRLHVLSRLMTSGCTRLANQESAQNLWTEQYVSLALQAVPPDQQRLVVLSISPQSRASLAARFQLSPTDTAKKLTSFFKKIGRHKTVGEHHSFKTRGCLVSEAFPVSESQAAAL